MAASTALQAWVGREVWWHGLRYTVRWVGTTPRGCDPRVKLESDTGRVEWCDWQDLEREQDRVKARSQEAARWWTCQSCGAENLRESGDTCRCGYHRHVGLGG